MSLDSIATRLRVAKDREHHAACECQRIAQVLVLIGDEMRGDNWKQARFTNDCRVTNPTNLLLSEVFIDLSQFPTVETIATTFNEWKEAASELIRAQAEWDAHKP